MAKVTVERDCTTTYMCGKATITNSCDDTVNPFHCYFLDEGGEVLPSSSWLTVQHLLDMKQCINRALRDANDVRAIEFVEERS